MDKTEIGHNQPPDMATTADDTARDLSNWMAEHPIIETEEDARQAKLLVDRAKLGIADLEDERKNKTDPLNQKVKEINDYYRPSRTQLEKVVDELRFRVTDFLAREEAKRITIAEQARKIAEEAEQRARNAEQKERDAFDAASQGELGVDIATVTSDADLAFEEWKKTKRQEVIAERETKVRLGGGFTRALSLRNTENLYVTNLLAAVGAMKQSARIVEAVIKSARSYKKVYGKYPPGIEVEIERKV